MGVIGAILGDIAGSRFEFMWDDASLNYRRNQNYEMFSDKNFATDDTFMTIACMDACLHGGDFAKYYRKYGLKYPASYGGRFGMWLICPLMGPYGSYGNGSAMRVSYIGEHYPLVGEDSVEKMATLSAEVTHNHEEGIKGAVVTATCIAMAKKGSSKDEILEYAISQYNSKDKNHPYMYGCNLPYKSYKYSMKMDESCMNSVPVAIRCFYESESFEECMRMINAMCCDTDTVCAIAGSICESYYGYCYSKEKDEELIRRYLPKELSLFLEENGIFEKREVVKLVNDSKIKGKSHCSLFSFFKNHEKKAKNPIENDSFEEEEER